MKENRYDDPEFFEQYEKMERSEKGLTGAGEWHVLKNMLPDFTGRHVLDLGCGFGWHCRYAMENGAASVCGVDLSEKMLERAAAINSMDGIGYERRALEEADYPDDSFDVIVSSLAFHYVADWDSMVAKMVRWLTPGGRLVFSVEHPVFTARGNQQWYYDEKGDRVHWPVDRYFEEGRREAIFLGEIITKYHRTLNSYLGALTRHGLRLIDVVEPYPDAEALVRCEDMQDEMRRPMMLIVSAEKPV